jgi:hypothetical protein
MVKVSTENSSGGNCGEISTAAYNKNFNTKLRRLFPKKCTYKSRVE